MTLSAVSTRYAHALADVVTASDSPLRAEDALKQLRAFQEILRSSAALQSVLETPAVPVARKRAVVGRVGYMAELSQITRNFLYVLLDHRRIGLLNDIIHSFELAVDERLGFARAEISTASKLSEDLQTELRVRLEQISKKRLRARYTVDHSLIGGVVARIGSTVYNGSVRGRLDVLKRQMRAES
ncbi:MAG TPA: ATP synthase F1 subunit delta [Bryobacteraceae bacterium]|jgi:F-type H+-transporting ATPase subunit delta|nr:ATP synthase F1 subunit delta [Bryobacteraceae bacterium]